MLISPLAAMASSGKTRRRKEIAGGLVEEMLDVEYMCVAVAQIRSFYNMCEIS